MLGDASYILYIHFCSIPETALPTREKKKHKNSI